MKRNALAHREACRMASSENILLIPGIEYSDPTNVIHLLVWGDVPFIGSRVEPEQVLAAAQEHGGITVLAHPSRKEAWKRFDPNWSPMLNGIEFWNRKADGWAPSKEAWELLRMSNAVPFAGLDFHDSRQFFPMTTILEMPGLVDETTVLDVLRGATRPIRGFRLWGCGAYGWSSRRCLAPRRVFATGRGEAIPTGLIKLKGKGRFLIFLVPQIKKKI